MGQQEYIILTFQTLRFKVWEHPNLMVSTLTLKINFLFFYFCKNGIAYVT